MKKFFINAIDSNLLAKISFDNGNKKMLCNMVVHFKENKIHAGSGFSIMKYVDEYQNSIGNWERIKNKHFIWVENENPKLEINQLIYYGFLNHCQKSTDTLKGFKNHTNPNLEEVYFSLKVMVNSNENKTDNLVFETKIYQFGNGFFFDEYTNVFGFNEKSGWDLLPFTQIPNLELGNFFPHNVIYELFKQKVKSSFNEALTVHKQKKS